MPLKGLQSHSKEDDSNMDKISGGELIVRCLLEENAQFIFGVPGDQLYPIKEACYEQKNQIRWVTFRHNLILEIQY